ncbi:hypothetical protein K435DRAFT_590335, partial [Dendrothele bispora CBS 962.96]
IISKTISEYNLNQKKTQAFQITSSQYLNRYVFQSSAEAECGPLRMFLTGPGGIGKTHVLNAVKFVMKMYGMDHRIRFLVPTGKAASLINGMTICRGLGIKIKSQQKVLINVNNRSELRAEWKDVDLLFIDEISLLD